MSWGYFSRRKARRLPAIAKWINESTDHKAEIREGYCNTDRDIPGTRLRQPGKGKYGNLLIVKNPEGANVFKHNSAETYRMNYEVELWIENYFGIKTIDSNDNTNFNRREQRMIQHKGTDPEGIAIADKIGVRYEGIQEGFGNIPSIMMFTDILQTRGTFAADSLEDAKTRLTSMRELFNRKS